MKNPTPNRIGLLSPEAWLLLLLGLSVYRMFLTGDRDVIALNSPHDEFWYVHRAFTGVWAGQYDEMAFVHSPVYVWWLQLLKIFGIPLRLGIDAALVAATAYLSISVNRFTGSRIAALAVAAFLLLHPYTVFIFDRSLAETLLVVTITVCLAAVLEIWTFRGTPIAGRRMVAVLLLPLMFAISFHLRKEGVALLVPFLALALLTLVKRESLWSRDGNGGLPAGVLLFLLPLAATICLGLAISTFNYFKWGTFSRYDLANTGYEDAVSALTRIHTGRTPLHVSVTRKMLAAGYAASPTLRELKPQMEGSVGQQWRDISSPFVATKGEIGNGWFYWALRDAAAHSGWHADARIAEIKYSSVSKELQAAFASGSLRERTSLLPSFVDPDFRKWLPALPASIANIVRVSVLPLPADVAAPKDNATPKQFSEYSSVVGRRNPPASIDMLGWVVAPAGTQAGFATGGAEPEWAPISSSPRPDVPGAIAIQIASWGIAEPNRLVFKTPSGEQGYVLVTDMRTGMTATTSGDFSTTLGVDALNASDSQRVADSSLGWLVQFARLVGVGLGVALLFSCSMAAFRGKMDGLIVIAMACLLFCATRVGMFALLDASSWNGAQARYMMPLLPLIALSGALGLAYLLRRVGPVLPKPAHDTSIES